MNLDPAHNEILVGDLGGHSVLVFPWNANGDVPPLRKLQGSNTRLGHVVGVAVDPKTNLLAVANSREILLFNRTDTGDIPPRSAIEGPKSGIGDEPWQLQIHDGKIFVAASNHLHQWVYPPGQIKPGAGWKEVPHDPWNDPVPGFIGVWKITDRGDTPPWAVIKGPKSKLFHPSGLALNVTDGEIFASDSVDNAVKTYRAPQLFEKTRRSPQ